MLLLQRFYQCYKRNCFKTETVYFLNKSMIFLANIRTIQHELLSWRMILIAVSMLILYPFFNVYYLKSPVLSYFSLYYFETDNVIILFILLLLLIGYNFAICYIAQKLIVIYTRITKEAEATLLNKDNNEQHLYLHEDEHIAFIPPIIEFILYLIFYIICLTVSISYILLENDNIFNFTYSTRSFITYSISFLLAILNAIITPRMVTSACLAFNIQINKHRSKVIVLSRTFTTIIIPLVASIIFLNDCGSVWTKMWKPCLTNNSSPFDINLSIQPPQYYGDDVVINFDYIYLNILDKDQICLSRTLFEINWNRCFHSFLSSWTQVLITKMIIMIFMPIFIVGFKLLRRKCIVMCCTTAIKININNYQKINWK
eukprot:467390_1